jgi:hypothetical protein
MAVVVAVLATRVILPGRERPPGGRCARAAARGGGGDLLVAGIGWFAVHRQGLPAGVAATG